MEKKLLVNEYILALIKHMYETYLHEYRHYDQTIGAFSSFCVVCVQLMIVVDQLNLEHTERTSIVIEADLYSWCKMERQM